MRGSKSKRQKSHARRRMRERHGIQFTRDAHAELLRQIQSGEAEFVGRQSVRVTIWDVVYEGKTLRVIYDRKRKNIVTVLPESA